MPRPIAYVFLSLTLILTGPAFSTAGTLSEHLSDHIAGRNGDEFVRVLIAPVSDFDPVALKESLAGAGWSRAERHRLGMARLQDAARRSQEEVLTALRGLETNGRAKNIREFWIANLIEAELTVAELSALAGNGRIESIELYPTVASIPMVPSSRTSPSFQAVGGNLKAIKADSAWGEGYDGRGRIVCSFDTGVDGLHPALIGNYRGNKGYPASQCWFSSVDSSDYPHFFSSPSNVVMHGTHTTGIMIGHDDLTGDTIGVAPGADWIAAVAIDLPGASVFEAFQWAADPDGDPNTVSDVPDVINHSWGVIGIGCADIFWDVIDNVEALGIVNIFSGGNEGPAEGSIRNPANRATNAITNFGVGALDSTCSNIWYASSRGPSECGSIPIKPNITAPGDVIRSSIPEGGYSGFPDSIYFRFSGSSAAAPHVSGAVAILRQKNPDATVEEIKVALLLSARDLGAPNPDNTYGWGALDIMEALRRIDSLTLPSLEIARFEYPEINPGDQVKATLSLKNVGAAADNVSAAFSNPDSGLTLLTNQINFGFIDRDSSVEGNTTLNVRFDESLPAGCFRSLDMLVTDGNGYSQTHRITFFVGSRGERTYFHHDTGRVKFTVSNYGAFGFHGSTGFKGLTGSFIPLGFEGYRLDRDTNDLYQGALVIGVDSMHVSDCAKNIAIEPDNDFAILPGGSIVASSPGEVADQETVSWFDDRYAENPIGLTIRQRTYGWASSPDNTFVILEYVITNTSESAVNGVRVGLFFDWDIREYWRNKGSLLPGDDIGYVCWAGNDAPADFRGVKVLNHEGMVNHRMYLHSLDIADTRFTEGRKYKGLADASFGSYTNPFDVAHMTATGPFNLEVGESDTAAFAVIGGATWTEFMESATLAEQKYADIPTDADDLMAQLPKSFTLRQNHPNPFNPATAISFTIPRADRVRVDIFDILGRLVATVHDGTLPAGEHTVVWTGIDDHGNAAASGIYLYRVRFGDADLTRKMVLVK